MEGHYGLKAGSGTRCGTAGIGVLVQAASWLLLASLVWGSLPLPAGATDESSAAESPAVELPTDESSVERSAIRVVGREALIGRLVPITGDPIAVRSVDLRVEFRRNSAELTEGAIAQLRELGEALISDALQEATLGVYGHTDTSGPADFNRTLSERRAQAVAAFLREHFAIAETRFREVRGYGEDRPRADLPPTAPAQRRVEIVAFHALSRGGTGDRVEEVNGPALGRPLRSTGGESGITGESAAEAPAASGIREESRGDGDKKVETSDYIVVQ